MCPGAMLSVGLVDKHAKNPYLVHTVDPELLESRMPCYFICESNYTGKDDDGLHFDLQVRMRWLKSQMAVIIDNAFSL